ncbi:MAG: serine hydrolase [Bacteroidota bacterium]
MSALTLITAVLAIFAVHPMLGQPTDLSAPLVQSIEKRIGGELNPSIAIGIVDENGPRFYNFGYTQVDGEPVNEHTIYEIGSITKVFTAILLAQQVLDGKVNLDDPINQYLPPEAQVPAKGDQAITLGSLSDHTSGIPRLPTNMAPANPKNPYADYTVDQMYTFIGSYEPSREVGAAYEYSNLAQGLLGHILAQNAKMPYEQLMTENIAEPLNMAETGIKFNDQMKAHLAPGHANGEITDNWDIPTLAGAGAIRSSTADMLKFLAANLGIERSPLLDAMELTHQVRHNQAGEMRVGLGWHIKAGKEGDVIWHNGGTGGYRAFAGLVKETGKGVVVLTNSSISVDDIGFHLLDSGSELNPIQTKDDAVAVSEETLEKYVGRYELAPNFHIEITKEGTQLYGQATGQDRFELFAKSETEFFLTVAEARVTFQVEDDTVESLTLFQAGQEIPGKKVE